MANKGTSLSDLQDQKKKLDRKIEAYKNKVERLEAAESTIGKKYEEIKKLITSLEEMGDCSWTGENKRSFDSFINNTASPDYTRYLKQVSSAKEQIEKERISIQNKSTTASEKVLEIVGQMMYTEGYGENRRASTIKSPQEVYAETAQNPDLVIPDSKNKTGEEVSPILGLRDDQIPDELSPIEMAILQDKSPLEQKQWYKDNLEINGVTVTGKSGETFKVLPEEYFNSYAELYKRADRLNIDQYEILSYPDSIAQDQFAQRLDRLFVLINKYKTLLTGDIQRLNEIGNDFLELDKQLAKDPFSK